MTTKLRTDEGDILLWEVCRISTEDLETIREKVKNYEPIKEKLMNEADAAKGRKIFDRLDTLVNTLIFLVGFETAQWSTGKEKLYLKRVR